jgi:LacI family transcriptional regulator
VPKVCKVTHGVGHGLLEPTRANGQRGVEELLELPRTPTAVIVGGGALSIGAAQAVRESGLRLPDDLSLVVYGDPSWFALSDPALSRITVSYDDLAHRAARLLIERLDEPGGTVPDEPGAGAEYVLAELHLAGSTGPPRRQASARSRKPRR